MNPGPWGGDNQNKALRQATVKAIWDKLHKDFWDEQNMNKALVTRCMAHLDPNIVQSFQSELQTDPNKYFCHVFEWFFERYGASNETE